MKTGLVLEGGAMRGLFSVGVIDVFLENDINFEAMVGVSAGAAFGCNYISRQKGRALRYNVDYCRNWKYCSFRSLLFTGNMFGADFCYHELPDKLDIFDVETFKNNETDFYVVATDVETGKAVYHKCTDAGYSDLEWIRASASMPLVSQIVKADSFKLLDGGIADSIPLKFFKELGYEKNVVVLTQPRDYIKGKNKLIGLSKILLRKYPHLLDTMERRHEIYNEQRKYLFEEEKKGNVLIICPKEKLPVGRIEHDAEKLKEAYEIGKNEALEKLEKIREFIK